MNVEKLLKEPKDVGKIKSIISYFTYKMGGRYLSTRRLMKLYYMAELRSIEKFQRRLSKAEFMNWDYGPWSLDVVLAADMLDSIKIELQEPADKYPGKRYVPSLEKTIVTLSKEEMEILDDVIVSWKYRKTEQLVRKTKISAPFVWSEYGQKLDFEKLIGCYDKTYGNPALLASIKKSREEIAQNKTLSIINEGELKNFISGLKG